MCTSTRNTGVRVCVCRFSFTHISALDFGLAANRHYKQSHQDYSMPFSYSHTHARATIYVSRDSCVDTSIAACVLVLSYDFSLAVCVARLINSGVLNSTSEEITLRSREEERMKCVCVGIEAAYILSSIVSILPHQLFIILRSMWMYETN